jgi:transposase
MDLTDAQWAVLDPLFRPRRRSDGRGRPWRDTRAVVNGVLWILRTGAPWHDLPNRYPPYQTCHRRFQHWLRSGVLLKLLQKLAEDLRDRGKLDLSEAFVERQLQRGEKRGSAIGPTRRGKGSKIMAISDGHGLPLAVHVASASPHETKLVVRTPFQYAVDHGHVDYVILGDRVMNLGSGYGEDNFPSYVKKLGNSFACGRALSVVFRTRTTAT